MEAAMSSTPLVPISALPPTPASSTLGPLLTSENCLYVNVFRPAYTPGAGETFPVMVYVHGGDFSTGSGAAQVYDGDYLASRGHVIVVTFNYRLGAFGFLSIFDDYGDAVGNFGFQDQQAALEWVQVNIAAFNGDPTKVTVMGDGAGCVSVVSHLASRRSQPLFTSAVLQSCPLAIPYRSEAEARRQAEAFAQVIDCALNDVICYRRKTEADVLNAQLAVGAERYSGNMLMTFYPWGPSIDNKVIVYHPVDVFKEVSRFEMKPVLIGTTDEEGLHFVFNRFRTPLTSDYFRAIVSSATGRNETWALTKSDAREALVGFITEFVFSCPAKFAAEQIGEKFRQMKVRTFGNSRSSSTRDSSSPHVWLYKYVYPESVSLTASAQQIRLTSALWTRGRPNPDLLCTARSCHGQDIRTLFNSESLPLVERLNVETLARQMVRYWSNFARSKSVNGRINSRSYLRTLQLRSALLSDSPSSLPWARPRGQRINILSPGSNGRPYISVPRSALQTALASFTYWPAYSVSDVEGGDSRSSMMLQTPPLTVRRFYWQAKCSSWNY
ncbi:acetylcholinesterase-like [Aplysia californica]|uniref:Acetylcholinesterase-like n=1 Tax=Aplysia californica TaxID=6500 RepID=A0ABM0KAT1_APLCA|nr:acetylcholinesterase-like [Aplysia californica]